MESHENLYQLLKIWAFDNEIWLDAGKYLLHSKNTSI